MYLRVLFSMVGNEVITISFACEKFMSGTCGNGKDTWNMVIAGDEQSPGIKKVVLHLRDTVDTEAHSSSRSIGAASSKLQAAHAALWKVYEGTIRIQDMFTKVTDASTRLDAIHNKLSLLRDASNSFKANPVKSEDDDAMPNPTLTDPMALHYICILLWMFFSCDTLQVLAQHCGNPNPDQASSMMPWAFYIIPSDPINIPMQLMKRKSQADMSAGLIPKHAKLEVP
ncbi:hypothetical protein EDD16DRAFT_1525998 [Pisolithus croceorrhizus]|nr:hypothetical protein EDD16DRAFT_1525998 [Pisolithus croceorrhizus]KAI6156162.1 hypothetical protein EDD17DRAFT_1512635 [Pisolithus thermaeus]